MDVNLKMILVNYFIALSILLFLLIQKRKKNKRLVTSHKPKKEIQIMLDNPDDDKFLSSIFSEIRSSIAVSANADDNER